MQGSDMGRARAAGFDDGGSMEELGEEVLATGVAIDPGTSRVLRFMLEPRGAALGYEPGDVHCWLGGVERFVARGSFGDVQEGEADIGGSFAVDGSLLAHSPEGDPDNLLAGDEPTASLRGLVEAFDRHGAVSFVGITPSEDRRDMWAGVALAHGEGWELLAVWSYPDAGAAEAAESDIAEILRAESELGDMVEDDPTTVSRAVRSWRVWRRGLGWGGRG